MKEKKKRLAALSFAGDGDFGDNDDEIVSENDEELNINSHKQLQQASIKDGNNNKNHKRITKNPEVDTSFLPDQEREQRAKEERERLRREWMDRQKAIKEEMLEITYSYWDGTGHRRTVQCKKGDTVAKFLELVR